MNLPDMDYDHRHVDHRVTILVVDDDWLNRELMEALLESAGYAVLLAAGGDVGFRLAQEHHPHLILVDVRLRYDTEGYELCRQLKANPATADIRVAMLTAMEGDADRQMAREAGADAFISRMLDTPLLLERISELID